MIPLLLAAALSCPLESEGLLWTAQTDSYTVFVSNPTHMAIPIESIDITALKPTASDVGEEPDPANFQTIKIKVSAQAAPLAVTEVQVKADIDPNRAVNSSVECSAT